MCVQEWDSFRRHSKIWTKVWLSPDVFARCTNLRLLHLAFCEADNLDFSNCSSLQRARFQGVQLVRTLLGLSAATDLFELDVSSCYDLVGIPGLGHLFGLQELCLKSNLKFKKLLDLQKLTRLQILDIPKLKIGGFGCLQQLLKLTCGVLSCSAKLPNLSGFEQLQTVDFSGSSELNSLEGVFAGDVPALQRLNLSYCASLSRFPDLSGLTNLEELDLVMSGIELREEDICMVAALPLLRPVRVSLGVTLDLVRRKI